MPKYFYKRISSDKRSLASFLEQNYKEKEEFVNSVFIGLKICFAFVALVSLIKIGYSSKVRLNRMREIKVAYLKEQSRIKGLSSRFDDLFSFDGEQRFMKDQDQMISRDIIRVIWH